VKGGEKMAKAAKTEKKAPKPNGMYRKPIPEARFEKKYLKLVEQTKDRELLASCFEKNEGGYSLKAGIGRDSMLKINKLAKAIKSNRGLFKAGPVIAILLLLGGLAVFLLFIMNPLLEGALETALQNLFGARATVTALRFEPWRMRMAIARAEVADAQAPMTNLFETGRIELRLNASAILRGKVYVEEAAVESLAFGGARKTSGALPGAQAAADGEASSEKPKKAEAAMVDFQKFDAKALLEREKSKFASLAAYENAGKAYKEASERWKAKVESSKAAVENLKASSKKALAIDVKAIKTVDQAATAIKDANDALADAKKAGAEADSAYKDIAKDAESLKKLSSDAKASYAADLSYMKSLIDPKSGAALAVLEPVLEQILSEKGQTYARYGRRGLDMALKLMAKPGKKEAPKGDKEKKPKIAKAAKGRDVVFPSGAYPAFRLGRLFSSFEAAEYDWKVELRELSTDPDLVNAPTTLSVELKGADREIKADALADLRTSAKELYSVKSDCSGIPFDLGAALSQAGLSGISGKLTAKAVLGGEKSGAMRLQADLAATSSKIGTASGTLGNALAAAIEKTDSIQAKASYAKDSTGKEDFSINTNLDKVVKEAVAAIAAQYAKKAMADLEKGMKRYFSEELEGKLGSQKDFDSLVAMAKGEKGASDEIEKSLDSKLAELEKKAKSLGAAVLPKVNIPRLLP
jgi:uncharacterized protein (TIGR03545 family)